eukprot:TRINITY_DN47306_c0_g1_i1.p1 TRINITY_DN47306_c0_g1~~TRINITY_DN47306_c0_g1_i1.p1  ORF type:complete len:194 (+),score=24.21 TRINITY_DN47306_c0_g1_i1:1-582(+)
MASWKLLSTCIVVCLTHAGWSHGHGVRTFDFSFEIDGYTSMVQSRNFQLGSTGERRPSLIQDKALQQLAQLAHLGGSPSPELETTNKQTDSSIPSTESNNEEQGLVGLPANETGSELTAEGTGSKFKAFLEALITLGHVLPRGMGFILWTIVLTFFWLFLGYACYLSWHACVTSEHRRLKPIGATSQKPQTRT